MTSTLASRCFFYVKMGSNKIKGGNRLERIRKQSTFYQKAVNQAKLGAYYTDQAHCSSIAEFLEFPEHEEVCVLEPAIGDAEAVRTVTKRCQNKNIHIFGVELNSQTAEAVLEKEGVEECIWGDFLTDVVIGQEIFSFCFSNPPYGEMDGNRLEVRFLKKIIPCLSDNAVLIYVIPDYVAVDDSFLREWCESFQTEKTYRFREDEYQKWKQVVFFGRKTKETKSNEKKMIREKLLTGRGLERLPVHYEGKKIKVYPSNRKDISEFAAKHFNEERIRKGLIESPLATIVLDRIIPKPFVSDQLSRPPIMPNQGQLYLMAVSGAGQGMVGSSDSKDLHLQRGIVKPAVEENVYEENGKMYLSVQKYTEMKFNIIENDGTRHQL